MEEIVGTCTNWIARDILRFFDEKGIAVDPILHHSGIVRCELERPEGRLTQDQYAKLLKSLTRYTSQYYDYLMVKQQQSEYLQFLYSQSPDLLGLCLNSPDVEHCLQHFFAHRSLIENTNQIEIECYPQAWHLNVESSGCNESNTLAAISYFILIYELLHNYTPVPKVTIYLPLSSTAYQSKLATAFDNQCVYHAGTTQMVIDQSTLITQHPYWNATLYALQLERVARLNTSLDEQTSWRQHVIEQIERQLGNQSSTPDTHLLHQVCFELKVSRWTLNLRLKEEQTSFTELVKKVRIDKACELLTQTHLSLLDISDQLGFSSQAVFSRFFKTALNRTPLAYRNGHQG